MEYMGDKNYWDEKFLNRSDKPLKPEKSLIKIIKSFKAGSVLDIACGDGRNSLFMSENGFEVTGIDFSSEALKRLERFAERKHLKIRTKQIDLSSFQKFSSLGIFDNAVINHYRLNKALVNDLHNHISKDGILFICGFGSNHNVDSKVRKEDLIQESDFQEIHKYFDLVNFKEEKDDRGSFVTYIFKRK